jgi:hypothetical protein
VTVSIRVFVVCEDHTLDQYVVRPVISALLSHLGKPKSVVKVVTDPKLNGIDSLKREFDGILARYSAIGNIVVFAIDADGNDGRPGKSDRQKNFEELLASCADADAGAVVAALQELEVWALWGSKGQIKESWANVRKEMHPKETYFDRLLIDADKRHPGKGRARLIEISLSSGWPSLAKGCPELGVLEDRFRAVLAKSASS